MIVESIYVDQPSLQADLEVQEWFEILRQEIPGMYPSLTRSTLSSILFRFHSCVVFHDMFHRLEPLVNIGTSTKDGDVLSLFPSIYEHIIGYGLVGGIIAEQAKQGMPFGFFWGNLFSKDDKYQRILDIATVQIDALHDSNLGTIEYCKSTIMM